MSTTNTSTFTITNAEYLASKIAADLKQMQALYGDPSDARIDNYVQELVVLLKGGYLESIDYGYKKNGAWVLALSYAVHAATGQFIDNNPGRVPPGRDVSSAAFGSFLRQSSKYLALSGAEQTAIKGSILITRGDADDPQTGLGGLLDRTYTSGGQQVNRKIIG